MKGRSLAALGFAVLPAAAVAAGFYLLLGYRRDYLGHYAAGYGGTLSALATLLAAVPRARFTALASAAVLAGTLLCIGGGAWAEATVFRLAQFDPIDFCNQSIGAILAGLVALFIAGDSKPPDAALYPAIGIGIVFLYVGFHFALG